MRSFTAVPALLLALAEVVFPSQGFSQEVPLLGTELHRIQSRSGVEYDLYVELPAGYESEPDAEYPVIYITDAPHLFPMVVPFYRYMGLEAGLRPAILVGVTRPMTDVSDNGVIRQLDLTPTRDPEADAAFGARIGRQVRSGGGAEYLRVLVEDVAPWVEENFRASEERGLVGFSLGGMFAAYALLTRSSAFTHYLIGSPGLSWGDDFVPKLEEAYAEESKDLNARVFISVGDNERIGGRRTMNLSNAMAFAEKLSSRDYPSLELEYQVFSGETHNSVIPMTMSRGLVFLFGTN